jgi:hypothetical protein
MPETRAFLVRGTKVNVELHRGTEYDRRVVLTAEDVELVYGVDGDAGRIVADLVALYEDGDLAGIGADADQPSWADATLERLDITEVRA